MQILKGLACLIGACVLVVGGYLLTAIIAVLFVIAKAVGITLGLVAVVAYGLYEWFAPTDREP